MNKAADVILQVMVVSLAETWIEIPMSYDALKLLIVVSLAETWIEIYISFN